MNNYDNYEEEEDCLRGVVPIRQENGYNFTEVSWGNDNILRVAPTTTFGVFVAVWGGPDLEVHPIQGYPWNRATATLGDWGGSVYAGLITQEELVDLKVDFIKINAFPRRISLR